MTEGSSQAGTAMAAGAGVPRIVAEVRADGTGHLTVGTIREDIVGDDLAAAGAQITARIAALAAKIGAPLPAEVRDPDGLWVLLIHPDGRVDEAPTERPGTLRATGSGTASASGAHSGGAPLGAAEPAPVPAVPTSAGSAAAGHAGPTPVASAPIGSASGRFPAAGAAPAPSPRPTSTDSRSAYPAGSAGWPATGAIGTVAPAAGPTALQTGAAPTTSGVPGAAAASSAPSSAPGGAAPESAGRPTTTPADWSGTRPAAETAPHNEAALGELLATRHRPRRQIATRGWRVGLRRASLGLVRPGPGRKERQDRAAVDSIRRPLDGPRTVVVINPKGGAHKTTATLLLASAFGMQRGGYTLAWDNNETHGTLGWRSATTKAGRSALDLLEALPELSRTGEIRVGDLDGYVRSQTSEQFDVLASDDDAASGAFVDAESFAALHAVLTRFYRVLVVDTGNNIRSSNWRAAVEAADQLVIVSTIREDTAQSAAWAVDALRAAGMSEAVRRAVTILSEPAASVDKDLRKRLVQHFGLLTREVIEVPFDPALVAGGPIEYARLRRSTRDAWLRATAVVADGL
jgi:MinD-like ATPase involved in chromosome partitioning or flagellar assembly